jgi:hypothetical protein
MKRARGAWDAIGERRMLLDSLFSFLLPASSYELEATVLI